QCHQAAAKIHASGPDTPHEAHGEQLAINLRRRDVAQVMLRWSNVKVFGGPRIQDDLIGAGIDQQIRWMLIDTDGYYHFVQRSVMHRHSLVPGQLYRLSPFEMGRA